MTTIASNDKDLTNVSLEINENAFTFDKNERPNNESTSESHNLRSTIDEENNNGNEKGTNKRCKTKIYSLNQKKSLNPNHKQRKRFIRDGEQHHSGDFTVPYVSLSYAHTWLSEKNNGTDTWVEYRPEVTRKSIDAWSPFKISSGGNINDPAVEIFYSKSKKSDDTTVVFEFQGVDHLDIAKHPYVNMLMLEYLLPKVADELYLNSKSVLPSYDYYYVSKRKTLYYIVKEILGHFVSSCERKLRRVLKILGHKTK